MGASGAAPSPLLSRTSGCDAELRLIAEQAQMLTQASGAAIALLEGDVMRCRARAGATAPDLGAPLDTQSGLSGECVRGGITLLCDDTENDARVNLDVCRYLGIRSIAVLPISVEGGTVGVFEAFSSRPQAFSSNELAALESMRDLVISVIRPAPQSQNPAVAALNARASQERSSPLAGLFDPEDDLICELEQRAPAQPQADAARRTFELIKSGKDEAAAAPAAPAPVPFANPDPGDDLICEIETRSYAPLEPVAETGHAHPFSTFAPAPAHPPERPVSRKLIILGIVVALAGLMWLRWCNRAQSAAPNLPRAGTQAPSLSPAPLPRALFAAPRAKADSLAFLAGGRVRLIAPRMNTIGTPASYPGV
ncbi:MAG TPA: GAF domain-containing protein, partial [Terriglobales bacterium]|nr:GAF domain-containing protein [Terriglobales bacterium]